MSNFNLKQFYPANGVISSTDVNQNNTDITTATSDINGDNIRIEGLEMKNFKENPHIIFFDRQDNEAYETWGSATPASHNGWIYNAFSIPGVFAGQHYSQIGTPNVDYEYPINHDNLFAINTNANKGTKMQVNSTTGIPLEFDQKILVQWNVNVFDIYHNGTNTFSPPAVYISHLADNAMSGIGIGEYMWYIYPKFNTVSAALLDDDFKTANASGFYQDLGAGEYFDPSVLGTSQVAFNARRFDHASVVPIHFITATDGGNNNSNAAKYFSYDKLVQRNTIGGPSQIHGQHMFEVNIVNPATTLYGVQLFISGPHRLNTTGQFLEDQITDPPGGDYGVDVSIILERAALDVVIYSDATGTRSA